MKPTKEVRRIALALAWADGLEVEDAGTVMESWRWGGYLLSAQDAVAFLAIRGDARPPVPLIESVGTAS